jgi:predicted DNA-binding transcriptional regulator AlpA
MSGVWLSREAVLAALGVHRPTLWRLQQDKNFPQPIQRGFFEQREVLNWIKRHHWIGTSIADIRPDRRHVLIRCPSDQSSAQRRNKPDDANPVDWVSYGVMARVKGG